MQFVGLLLCMTMGYVHSWKPNYAGAQQIPSPNFTPGRAGQAITCVTFHGTGGEGAINWFQNPSSRASTHYVVEQDGKVTQMVSESDTAWHNGVISPTSIFKGRPNPNLWCIGIQFSRNANNDNVMPEVQIAAGVRLVADIQHRYKDIHVYTHDQFNVAGKPCPGPKFPWARFTKTV